MIIKKVLVILLRYLLYFLVKEDLRGLILWNLGLKGSFELLDFLGLFWETAGIDFVAVQFEGGYGFELFWGSDSGSGR